MGIGECAPEQRLFSPGVHPLELVRRDRVSIGATLLIEDEVVPALVAGEALFGLDAPGRSGDFSPYRRLLHIYAWTDLAIRPSKRHAVHRVDITLVVDDPVARLTALDGAPFLVGEALRV